MNSCGWQVTFDFHLIFPASLITFISPIYSQPILCIIDIIGNLCTLLLSLPEKNLIILPVGSITEPLRCEGIRQYLVLVLEEYPHNITLENCRQFCKFFDRKFEKSTRITFPEISKQLSLRERHKNSGHENKKLFIHHCLNPDFLVIAAFTTLMRIIALYHFLMVPGKFILVSFDYFAELSEVTV